MGRTVYHVWEREGTELARVAFVVHGPRWRVYSTKNLEPSWTGEWTVRVEDESGRVILSKGLSYVPAGVHADTQEASAEADQRAAGIAAPPASRAGE